MAFIARLTDDQVEMLRRRMTGTHSVHDGLLLVYLGDSLRAQAINAVLLADEAIAAAKKARDQ